MQIYICVLFRNSRKDLYVLFFKNAILELPKQLLKELGWRNNERLNASPLNDNLILQRVPHTVRNHLLIHCFGNFSIEWNGAEINLKNKKLIALSAIEDGVFSVNHILTAHYGLILRQKK